MKKKEERDKYRLAVLEERNEQLHKIETENAENLLKARQILMKLIKEGIIFIKA